ncbi:MAG: hypothetical protein EBR07_08785, partial [Planctomycetes bacterium]|nr:hypothetical protein [Planctomycetota bacterium]
MNTTTIHRRPWLAIVSISAVSSALMLGLAQQQEPAAPKTVTPAATATTGPQVFTVDDVHSMALFRVQHFGAGQFWGRFNDIE